MNQRLLNWSLFVVLCFIWGSSFILMRYSKERLDATQIASLRIFSAGIVFLPFAVFNLRKIPKAKIFPVLLAGIFGNLLPAFLFAIAIGKNIDSSLAGILNSLTPICVVIIGISVFRDKIRTQQILGVLIGFAGLLLLTLSKSAIHLDNFGYALLIVLATLFYGININLVSHYLKSVSPVTISTVSLGFLAIPTGFILWRWGFFKIDYSSVQLRWSIGATLVLGIFGTAIATILFYVLVKRAGGLFAALVTYGTPFVALFWGFIYGEKITLVEILCLLLILAGVYLANLRGSKTKSPAADLA